MRLEECLVQMDAARGVSTFIEADDSASAALRSAGNVGPVRR